MLAVLDLILAFEFLEQIDEHFHLQIDNYGTGFFCYNKVQQLVELKIFSV